MITGFVTVAALLAFLAGAAWAYSGRRKPEFDDAARIPLENPEDAP
ncbi:CcoQ/FixQ family Cbb3-type cytochrome c oxidase assembly chaperone [Arenimonas sp. MALMAid1274]